MTLVSRIRTRVGEPPVGSVIVAKMIINSDPSRWSSSNSELLGCFNTGGAQVGPGSIGYHVGMETVRAAGMVWGMRLVMMLGHCDWSLKQKGEDLR